MNPRFACAAFLAASILFAQVDNEAHTLPAPATTPGDLNDLPLDKHSREALQQALKANDLRKVEKLLVEQIEAHPRSAELLAYSARIFMRDRDARNAAIAFRRADAIRPLDPTDRYSMAMALLGFHQTDLARQELNKLAQDDPLNPRIPYWLARLDYDDHHYEAAVEKLRKVVVAAPNFVRAWDTLALSLEGVGKVDEAAETYAKVVDLNRADHPPSPWPPVNYGALLTKTGKYDQAEKVLREALTYEPKLAIAHLRLGMNLQKQGRKPEAVKEIKRAAELAPADPLPQYTLSQLYRDTGDAKAAAEALEKFQALKKAQEGS